MQAEIITIGDEILIGQTVDTNSAWMGENLNEVGVDVHRIISVRDREDAILEALTLIQPDTQLVFITGGLGPTKDDITKNVLTQYFGGHLEFREDVFNHIKDLFSQMGRDISDLNRSQAFLPNNCEALRNDMGTAWGMRFRDSAGRYFISMPGVPYEMKFLMREHLLPWIKSNLSDIDIIHRTFHTQGIPESVLAHRLAEWEDGLPSALKLAYLPSPGLVKLRLTARGDSSVLIPLLDLAEEGLRKLLGNEIIDGESGNLQALIGQLLLKSKATLSTAESCTGGYIAHLLTSVPGSSAYFMGGVVSYSNELKTQLLDVNPLTIEKHGAVSEAVVLEMARGCKHRLKTNYSIAVSGIAGPEGGTEEKPVGTVWIAIANDFEVKAWPFRFGNQRDRNIRRAGLMALDLLRKALMNDGNTNN